MPEVCGWVPVSGATPKPYLRIFITITITQFGGTTRPLRIIKIRLPPRLTEVSPRIIVAPICSVRDHRLLSTSCSTIDNRLEGNILSNLKKVISCNRRVRYRRN